MRMNKRIALPALEGFFLRDSGASMTTPLPALGANWDFNKLFGAMLPTKSPGAYPIMSWLLALKHTFMAELTIKGSFLLHIANQSQTHRPSDLDAILVIPRPLNERKHVLHHLLGRTCQLFGWPNLTESQCLDAFYLKIVRHDKGFLLKTSPAFYAQPQLSLYGKDIFPAYLPIDIEVVLGDENPRNAMVQQWTTDSLVTSHRLVYPQVPFAPPEMLSREIDMSVIDRLLAQHLLVVGPFPNTMDLFRLIKFRQRGYVFIEPNLEKKCLENTITQFTDQTCQDVFLNRAKAVLMAVTQKNDKASLLAFCDLFQKLYNTLVSRSLHTRLHHSLNEIATTAKSALDGVSLDGLAATKTFSERVDVLKNTVVQLAALQTEPPLLAFAGYVLISDLAPEPSVPMDAASLVKGIYHYLDPKTFSEQQAADAQALHYLKMFGVSVTLENLEVPSLCLDHQEKDVLAILAEAGSYPARLMLKKQAFLDKQTAKLFANKRHAFNSMREAARVSLGYTLMGQLRIKRHFFTLMHHNATVQKTVIQKTRGAYQQKQVFRAWHGMMVKNRLISRLDRLQRLYQTRCQMAEKATLKKAFLDFRKSVNDAYAAGLKAAFLSALATTGFPINTQSALQDISHQYKRFLKTTLPKIPVLKDLEAFVEKQLPAIAFVRDTFKLDLSAALLANKNIIFISQSRLDQVNLSLNKQQKIKNPLGVDYWAPAHVGALQTRITELETHSQTKSGLVDRFCDVFYSLEPHCQKTYIRHFAQEKSFAWASPILKSLFLNNPACFIASFFKEVSPEALERFLMPESDAVLDLLYHRLHASFGDASIRALENREFAQLYIIDLRWQSGTSPKVLLERFGDSLLTLIDRSGFQNTPACVAIKKEHAMAFNQTRLRVLQGAAILLLCVAGHLSKNSEYKESARYLAGFALFVIGTLWGRALCSLVSKPAPKFQPLQGDL